MRVLFKSDSGTSINKTDRATFHSGNPDDAFCYFDAGSFCPNRPELIKPKAYVRPWYLSITARSILPRGALLPVHNSNWT